MTSPAPKRMTLAEFLQWDDGTDRRYELLDGIAVMMAPSLEAHGELAAALAIELGNRFKPPCRGISEAGIVICDRADTYYVADLSVTCAPREPGRRMVVEPVLVVEVLSPSTGRSTVGARSPTTDRCHPCRRSWSCSATSAGSRYKDARPTAGGSRT